VENAGIEYVAPDYGVENTELENVGTKLHGWKMWDKIMGKSMTLV